MAITWTPKAHEYARLLLVMAEANGLEVTRVYLDGSPFRIEAAGGRMPARFRLLFKRYIVGIAQILEARGSIRHEKFGAAWATKAEYGSSSGRKRMDESCFSIPDIEDIEMPAAVETAFTP